MTMPTDYSFEQFPRPRVLFCRLHQVVVMFHTLARITAMMKVSRRPDP